MKDCREEWFVPERKISVSIADVTSAAKQLARNHLCGPTAAHYLAKGLAAVALFGAEIEDDSETVVLQMKCEGPLGGLNVECAGGRTLRGYTERKTLDDFDGMGTPKDAAVIGAKRIQVTRSLPGKILSQGIAGSLDGYLSESLQRKAVIRLEATVTDEVDILEARGVLVEVMPDGVGDIPIAGLSRLDRSSRTILKEMGLGGAELRRTVPLSFGCRCSPERAAETLSALSPEERLTLPESVSVTCHMCGRTYAISTRIEGGAKS